MTNLATLDDTLHHEEVLRRIQAHAVVQIGVGLLELELDSPERHREQADAAMRGYDCRGWGGTRDRFARRMRWLRKGKKVQQHQDLCAAWRQRGGQSWSTSFLSRLDTSAPSRLCDAELHDAEAISPACACSRCHYLFELRGVIRVLRLKLKCKPVWCAALEEMQSSSLDACGRDAGGAPLPRTPSAWPVPRTFAHSRGNTKGRNRK